MSSGEPVPADALRRARMTEGRAGVRAAALGTWAPSGPGNIGGRLTALAVDPNDADHIWAGAAAGGIFESTDAGATWTPVFDEQPVYSIGALAAHPTDSDIVYVGTGEANGAGYSYEGDGIYRTIDGGTTWQHLGLAETRRIARIAIDPGDPQRLFVAAAGSAYVQDGFRGIYRSTDGGATWMRVLFVTDRAGAIDVAIAPGTPTRIFAAIWEHYSTATEWVAGGVNSGIWRSDDGGATWTRLTDGLPNPGADVGRIGLAVARSNPQVVYALYIDDPGWLIGLYRSSNAGQSWTKQRTSGAQGIFGGFGYYLGQVRVDPLNENMVYLMDVYWARSPAGGDGSWSVFTQGVYADHHDLVILPDRLYMANDGGFYRSTDLGATWFKAPDLPVTQFYDLGIDPVNTLFRYGGSQDTCSLRTAGDGSSNWYVFWGGDGFHAEVDPIDPLRIYFERDFGAIRRSIDGGWTSEPGTQGIATNDRKNWSVPIVHDPKTSQRLYTGTHRVYRSTNAAANWSPISGDLTDGPPATSASAASRTGGGSSHLESVVRGTVTTIAVSAVDGDVIWAGTDDGNVWVTPNGGSTWSHVDVPGRSEWVTRVEADPFSAAAAYVTFSGFRSGSRLPRIYRTVDWGTNWIDISHGLPDVPLNCVNADPDPAMRGRLFVCTDVGVWVTDDLGASWSELGTGMPHVVVHDLDLIDGSRELFAGTHGRSSFVYDLDQLGPADADGDGAHNVADCAPDDATVFAVPGEVSGLAFGDGQTLAWDSAVPATGSATLHQILRGSELPVGGSSDVCLAAGTPATTLTDPDVPLAGTAFWYLVRAKNACGIGTYGTARPGTACP